MRHQPELIQKDALKPLLQDPGQLICVLDACRYDIFGKINWLPGTLQKATSAGSTTVEWAINTFEDYYPVVYVSSVPYIAAKVVTEQQMKFLGLEHFLAVNDVWDWGYDEETATVLPEVVAHAAKQARKDYPDKTIIAHFIQPHCPYIGSPPLTLKIWEELTGEHTENFPTLQSIFEKGFKELLVEAYIGNLIRVLDVISQMNFERILITADHGESFGENGIYGHREGLTTPELLEVPWFNLT